jgi:hypothetical protein
VIAIAGDGIAGGLASRVMLCPTCTAPGAPRPSGTATYTYNGVTHKAAECAAIASVGETPIRASGSYVTDAGKVPCMACFAHGRQHTYPAGTDPHPDRDDRPRGPDIGPRRQG